MLQQQSLVYCYEVFGYKHTQNCIQWLSEWFGFKMFQQMKSMPYICMQDPWLNAFYKKNFAAEKIYFFFHSISV